MDFGKKDRIGSVYKPNTPINCFSKYERNDLLARKEFLENPEDFIRRYNRVEIKEDTQTFVFEGVIPRYHRNKNCSTLHNDYRNYYIPEIIKEKGLVKEFREWFKNNDPATMRQDVFEKRFFEKWGFTINLKALFKENSGISTIQNLDLNNVEKKIDALIEKAKRLSYESEMNAEIIGRFSQYTYLLKDGWDIPHNPTDEVTNKYTDEEILQVLERFNKEIKEPLRKELIIWYIVRLNSELKFDGFLLEQLNFKPCGVCEHNQ